MADQSEAYAEAAGQHGQVATGRASQDPRQGKSGEKKPGKSKPVGRRAVKPGEPTPRTAEVGMKGTGFVKLVKDNFGFISSPDFEEQFFFHGSEVVGEGIQEGASVPFQAGDEVEFIVGQNTGKRSNHVAKQVKKLPEHSVKAQILSTDRYQGVVTTELNSGQWRSEESTSGQISYQSGGEGTESSAIRFHAADTRNVRRMLTKGMKVEFSICTDNQTGELKAVHIDVKGKASKPPIQDALGAASISSSVVPTVLHGFIKSLKANAGVIRCIEREERVNFRKADVPPQLQGKLQVGAEVMLTISEARSGQPKILGFAFLPSGSLMTTRVSADVVHGRVVRPISLPDAERREEGMIVTSGEENDWQPSRVTFSSGMLEGSQDDAASLEVDDEVEFQLVCDFRADTTTVKSLKVTCKASHKRELGQIRTLKGNFGFIRCCQRSGDLFFHYTTLQNCSKDELKKNDDVEFTVQRSPEHGTIAVRVAKMPPGSAVFETVSEQENCGIVHSPVQHYPTASATSGVISYQENEGAAKILFGEHDFEEKVAVGDHVAFRIANNTNAATQARNLGAVVSRHIGRRATQGRLLKLEGVVRQAKGTFGFLKYSKPQADGSSVESSVFYHCSEVREGAVLKVGDEVAFGLWTNPKNNELNARRLFRTKEAPEEVSPASEAVADRIPAALKLTNTNAVPVAPVRMPAMPDGTRGFVFGRGSPLKPPYPPLLKPSAGGEVSNGAGTPGAPKTANGAQSNSGLQRSPSLGKSVKSSKGRTQSRSFPSITNLMAETKPAGPQTGPVLARTSSALNPAAPTFLPRTLPS